MPAIRVQAKVAKLTEETEKTAGDIYLKYGKKAVDKVCP